MVDFEQEFQVWTKMPGDNGDWLLRITTNDLSKATETFITLDANGAMVAMYEMGEYLHRKKLKVGLVVFLWNEAFNEFMQGVPERRGAGWSDEHDTYVEYDFPGREEWERSAVEGAAHESLSEEELNAPSEANFGQPYEPPLVSYSSYVPSVPVPTNEPLAYYEERACDDCGQLAPANLLTRYSHEVQTGRSSGTSRSSQSWSTTTSKNSWSSTSRGGVSRSSGRRYYKSEVLMLCEACLKKHRFEDGAKTGLKAAGFLGVAALFLLGGGS